MFKLGDSPFVPPLLPILTTNWGSRPVV